jgi:glucan biosynthesis protein C
MNEASFPVYIIHQTILVVVSFFVLKFKLGVPLEYFFIMALTFVISVALYEGIMKRTPITRWMFGVKIKKMPAAKNSVSHKL